MAEVISSLHQEGYKKKDKTSIIVFKGKKAHVLQRATTNVSRIVAKLPSIKGSSYTPLASALVKVENLIKAEQMKNRDVIPVVVICSDLGANISLKYPDLKSQTQEDFNIIAEELKVISKRFARKKIRTIILVPKKGQSIRFLGVNPFSIGKIIDNFKEHAEIFSFDGYNSNETVIKLKKML
jgi:magnesium chelatase subunit D